MRDFIDLIVVYNIGPMKVFLLHVKMAGRDPINLGKARLAFFNTRNLVPNPVDPAGSKMS